MEKQIQDIKNNKQAPTTQTNKPNTSVNQVEEKINEKNMLKFLENKMKEMETEFDLEENIVIDLGSAYTKIGFSGEDLPRVVLPSIFASIKLENSENNEKKTNLFGYEIFTDKDKLCYDVKHLHQGDDQKLLDYDEFKSLLTDIFFKEGIISSDHNVIINTFPIKNTKNIETLTKLFLEDFNFKGMSIMNQSSLALFANGRTSGLVVDCGEHKTLTVPIFEGFPLYHATNIIKIGGHDLSEIFLQGIKEDYPNFNQDQIIQIRDIKEKMSFIPYERDFEYYLKQEDIIKEHQRLYKLPDGTETTADRVESSENKLLLSGSESIILEIPRKCRLEAAELLFT